MLLAQLSDLHISTPDSDVERSSDSSPFMERAVQHLCRLEPRPDAVLITGDLVHDGHPEEYVRLAALLKPLPMPWFVIPGNHDDREHLRAAFGHLGYLPAKGFLQYVVEQGPLRLIGLDTHVPGKPGGLLCGERLAWLDARLAEAPKQPTLVFMHHPPFLTGVRVMDAMGLEGSDALAEVIGRHPQVERVLCGHLHRPIVKRFAGTVASTCSSTMLQLVLDLEVPGRLAMVREPPACQLHLWRESAGLVTHTSYIDDFRSRA
jgi:3',5'-cyclic AMP phosphodiesterase CpdA